MIHIKPVDLSAGFPAERTLHDQYPMPSKKPAHCAAHGTFLVLHPEGKMKSMITIICHKETVE